MGVKESEKIDKYMDLAREVKQTVEQEDDGVTNSSRCTWNATQKPGKSLEESEIRERIETIQTKPLRLARVFRRILEN